MTLNDEIKQLQSKATELQNKQESQITTLNEYFTNLNSVLVDAQKKYAEVEATISELTKEIDLFERNKLDLESSIKTNTNAVDTIKPEIKEAENKAQELVTMNEQLNNDNADLNTQITQKQQEINDAKVDLQTKRETLERLKKDIAEKSATINQKLEETQAKVAGVKDKFPATAFMFARGLEAAPKAEILTIIAAMRPVSNDQIKKGVSSVSPVQVQRFITMLEADGKIVLTDDDKWDLAPDFLAKLS